MGWLPIVVENGPVIDGLNMQFFIYPFNSIPVPNSTHLFRTGPNPFIIPFIYIYIHNKNMLCISQYMCVLILDLFAIISGKKISYINSLEIFLKKEKLQKKKRRQNGKKKTY